MTNIKIGDPAPDADFFRDGGDKIALENFRGKNIVLYFFPKADTSGCTAQSIDFTKLAAEFDKTNTVIIGMSKDSPEKQNRFKEKHALTIILGSDQNGICEKYGVWVEKSMYGKKYMGIERSSFLIDRDGKIVKIWRKVKVKDHAKHVLESIAK